MNDHFRVLVVYINLKYRSKTPEKPFVDKVHTHIYVYVYACMSVEYICVCGVEGNANLNELHIRQKLLLGTFRDPHAVNCTTERAAF